MSCDRSPNQGGFIFAVSLLCVAGLIVLASIGFQRSITELSATNRSVESLQAFHLAEAGLDDAHAYLDGLGAPPGGIGRFNPFGGPRAVGAHQFNAEIDPDDQNPTGFQDLFVLESTVTVGLVTRRVTKILANESFARYSYFTDSERIPPNTRVWFTGRDHLSGPVHSNDQFNISGSPIFDGQLTSSASSINYANPPPTGGNNPQFNGGLQLNAPAVTLPNNASKLRVAASAPEGLWLTGNTTITLQADGTMVVTNANRGWVDSVQPLPANGAMFVNGGNATVSGTLDGQLTIGATRDVIVANNLQYADDPRSNPASNDVLGLAAEQNLVVSRNAPYDVTIQASVMALNTSFTVERWWEGPPKGTLTVYGGIIQDSRGAVGSFNSVTGQQVSGYAKNYTYDTRFLDMAPPFFPTSGVYREVFWRQDQ